MYIFKLFKRRRKQCAKCLKTFYKAPLEMIGYDTYAYVCPHCGSDNYIEV